MREPPGPLWGRAVLLCVASPALWGCLWPHGCSGRRRARPPARLGGLTSFGAAPRSPPVPSGPSGALHTSGAWCAVGWLGASSRSPARPRHRPPALRQVPPAPSTPVGPGVLTCGWVRRLEAQLWLSTSNFARNSSMPHSNIEFASLELQRFWGVSKNDRDKLRATFGWRWCRRCPRVPQPCPVGQVVRWFETIVAFACWYLCGIETAIAFAGR